jgi:hypothetical protein
MRRIAPESPGAAGTLARPLPVLGTAGTAGGVLAGGVLAAGEPGGAGALGLATTGAESAGVAAPELSTGTIGAPEAVLSAPAPTPVAKP